MSSKKDSQKRRELLAAATDAIYATSTGAVFFHSAIANKVGLSALEEKTLLMLSSGPRTAGEIAEFTRLTTPSVTSLIDRLEAKGFVHRVRDINDRRRVYVQADATRLQELMSMFRSLEGPFNDLLTSYTDDELITITNYLNRASERTREAIDALGANTGNRNHAHKK